MPITSSSEPELWQTILTNDWDFAQVRVRLQHPWTKYPQRPELYDGEEIFDQGVLVPHGHNYSLHLNGRHLLVNQQQVFSVVAPTFKQLQKISSPDLGEPATAYLQQEFTRYQNLKDKRRYGFYALYFDRAGEFSSLVQFPTLPVFKLSLVAATGPLYRDRQYQRSWYDIRHQFNQTHILVAGASVAGAAAQALIRDGRIGALTIGDPKGPNPTNFNRTTYDVWDVAKEESKAIALARQIHAQDPTQIIYVAAAGFNTDNFASYLTPTADYPPVDLIVEAVDDIKQKVALLQMAKNACFPIMQIADVGSKAIISINNPSDQVCQRSLLLGVSDAKLRAVMAKNFLQASVYFVGVENVLSDEPGKFIKHKNATPFTETVPQMGSTALVAAGMVAEQGLRFLLDRESQRDFRFKRLILDKKNQQLKTQVRPTLKGQCLHCVLDVINAKK